MSPGRKDRMSRMNRRAFITLLGGTAIACPRAVLAQSYPSRPITMIVPFPAGGGADVLVRILTKHMADDLGQVIVVQNQPGAGGAIAPGETLIFVVDLVDVLALDAFVDFGEQAGLFPGELLRALQRFVGPTLGLHVSGYGTGKTKHRSRDESDQRA